MRLNARAACVWLVFWGILPLASGASEPRDSVVVDGSRVTYLAEVEVDTTRNEPLFQGDDWWMGVGWDVPVTFSNPEGSMSSLGLANNRPLLYLEHQQDRAGGRGRLGVFLAYSQPWELSESEVSPDVKGWIRSTSRASSSPLRQVVLTPDSLAYERDTLPAPLSSGHSLRLGLSWEGQNIRGWWPRVSLSADVWRPEVWKFMPPGDPALWQLAEAADTYQRIGWAAGRFRMEAGGVMDVGNATRFKRTASQFRASVCWVPGTYWGVAVALVASPTRR